MKPFFRALWRDIVELTKTMQRERKEHDRDEQECRRPKRFPAHSVVFTFRFGAVSLTGDFMQVTLLVGQTVAFTVSPVLADGVTPSQATLSNISFTSSDGSVFTVADDPATPNGGILTAVAVTPGATLTAAATATEPDGTTTEQIQGVATVVVNSTPPPPPPPAAGLVFSFGTPQ